MSLTRPLFRRPIGNILRALMVGAASLLIGASLCASMMRPLSIEEMTKEADAIVRGEVLSKICQRDARGRIYTEIELSIGEVWKGSLQTKKLAIVQGGGVLGEERVIVTGQVEYDLGEEVIAFVVYNAAHEAVTLGMTQGKFHLHHAPGSSVVYANNPFHGVTPGSEKKSSEARTKNRSSPESALTIADLKGKVLAAK